MNETIQYLKRAIEHAPKYHTYGQANDSLRGWTCGPEKVVICRECSGRIMQRGCQLPRPAEAIWDVKDEPCVLCGL